MTDNDVWVPKSEAHEYVKPAASTVRRWVSDGRLRVHGDLIWLPELLELERIMKRRRGRPRVKPPAGPI